MKATDTTSEAVRWQLTALLFTQTSIMVIGGGALLAVAIVGGVKTHQAWFVIWALAIALVLAIRVALDRAFVRRPLGEGPTVDVWLRRFTAAAWTMGAVYGATAFVILMHAPPVLQILALSVKTAIVIGSAARNASCRLAARGQIVLGIGPVFLASLAMRDPYYQILAAAVIFEGFAAFRLSSRLYERIVGFLVMNEQNLALLDAIRSVNDELAAANGKLATMAATDALTGIANRRRLDEVLAAETARAQRDGTDLAILLLDIDSFKGFNDLYGHQAGDDCLQRVAQAFAATILRPADLVARYGGEEFVAILPGTDAYGAAVLAHNIRAAIEDLQIVNAAGPVAVVSVSVGVAEFTAERHRRPEDFIRAADDALYAAKAAGRNCVRIAPMVDYRLERSDARKGAAL